MFSSLLNKIRPQRDMNSKTVKLANNAGWAKLTFDGTLLTLSPEDRAFVFDVIDKFNQPGKKPS